MLNFILKALPFKGCAFLLCALAPFSPIVIDAALGEVCKNIGLQGKYRNTERANAISAAEKLRNLSAAPEILNQIMPLGIPTGGQSGGTVLPFDRFVVGFAPGRRVPLWTAYTLHRDDLPAGPRPGTLLSDPRLPEDMQARCADYPPGSVYVPAQLTPGFNLRTSSLTAESHAFVMTNVAPQFRSFYRRIWSSLEKRVREWARARNQLHIISGTIFNADKYGAAMWLPPLGKVELPTHFFKIIVSESASGTFDAISFIIPHTENPVISDFDRFLENYTVQISDISDATGLTFLIGLDASVRSRLLAEKADKLWPPSGLPQERSTRQYNESFADFGDIESRLILNGWAAQKGEQTKYIELTPNETSGNGSIFLAEPFLIDSTTSFASKFTLSGDGSADGLAFIIQNDWRGARAWGGGSNALGYGSMWNSLPEREPIAPSTIIEFDTWFRNNTGDPPYQHVALTYDGDMTRHIAETSIPFNIYNVAVAHVWVQYDGPSRTLRVWMAADDTQPPTPLLTTEVDLISRVGRQAYFGFSAGSGGLPGAHRILSWDLKVTPPTQAVRAGPKRS